MMTKPSIVRADTLDLQNPSSPHAAEHNKRPNANGIAPHQAAQYQHVVKERHSEEQSLADAWSMPGALSDGLAATDTAGDEAPTADQNGADADDATDTVDGDQADHDADDDDDLMDRISSSPSIDEGEHLTHSPIPIQRAATPVRHTTNEASFNTSPQWSATDSSSYVNTPEHLLLRMHDEDPKACSSSPLGAAASPVISTPDSSPLLATATFAKLMSFSPKRHRRVGKYFQDTVEIADLEHGALFEDDRGGRAPQHWNRHDNAFRSPTELRTSVKHPSTSCPCRRSPDAVTQLDQSPSLTSITSVDLDEILLPTHDPLLSPSHSPTPSCGSWESLFSSGSDDGDADADDAFLDLDPSFMDSGWAGECLRETEDIDFEFVYALHTFVASVEGQANATKGDTMVLLDDTNSYWWLVRVVKDSSIGYLPAEHIETPDERLARLNKHRNIDLSQSMLGDNPEKSRNVLKIAMRRRNAKTVQFAAPTYVEASDYDYTDDEEHPNAEPYATDAPVEDLATNGQPAEVEERNAPEEANVHATRRYSGEQVAAPSKTSIDSSRKGSLDGIGDDPQLSPKLVDRSEAAPLKSRKGTPRNTDSFLKDDSIETRKITLTPGLLREEGNSPNPAPSPSNSASLDSQRNTSMESLVKTNSPPETASTTSSKKDSKEKKKDKKQGGMLSGLFKSKKKDKKGATDEGEKGDAEKVSTELTRSSSPRLNGASSPVDKNATQFAAAAAAAGRDVQVQGRGKLSKSPPGTPAIASRQPSDAAPRRKTGNAMAELAGSEAAYEMEGQNADIAPQGNADRDAVEDKAPPSTKESALAPVSSLLKSAPKATKARQRVELDDFDSPADTRDPNPFRDYQQRDRQSSDEADRIGGSPIEIVRSPGGTFMHGTENIHIPTSFDDDDDDEDEVKEEQEQQERFAPHQGGAEATKTGSSGSASLIEHPSEDEDSAGDVKELGEDDPRPAKPEDDATPTPTPMVTPPLYPPSRPAPAQPRSGAREHSGSSASSSGPEAETPKSASPAPTTGREHSWDDGALRAWLDAEEVKDMLTIVHSSAHAGGPVEPVADSHPMMRGLYSEERGAVGRMMGELDGLLMSWAGKKGAVFS